MRLVRIPRRTFSESPSRSTKRGKLFQKTTVNDSKASNPLLGGWWSDSKSGWANRNWAGSVSRESKVIWFHEPDVSVIQSLMLTFVLCLLAWSGLGLIGSILLLTKSARPERALFFVLFSLPHAIIFGPFFLLMGLVGRRQKLCPYCRSSIDRNATVCANCTRVLPTSP